MSDFRILIVDDDIVTRKMLQIALRSAGYVTSEAENGRVAFDMLSRDRFSLVISDWQMPEMDGLELCRQIRLHLSGSYLYTILLTSQNDTDDRVIGFQAGADDFVGKPFNKAELLQRVAAGERVLQLETKEALIFSLAKLAESRDTETGLHLERVQRYAKFLAERLRLAPNYRDEIDDGFVQLIFETSPLHDIGKVGIPDAVLLHPGKLSVEQFEVMKTHTTIGAECLRGAIAKSPGAKFLKMAYEIALGHHEKFDGSGYPYGKVGFDIPLSARIVAVADVYDALRSKRIYKDAFSHEKAVTIIRESSGTHFDPGVIASFLEIEREFEAIALRFDESFNEIPTAVLV